jgi:hypothetical protein
MAGEQTVDVYFLTEEHMFSVTDIAHMPLHSHQFTCACICQETTVSDAEAVH